MTNSVPFMLNEKRISVMVDFRWRSLSLDNKQGQELRDAVLKDPQDIDEIRRLSDVASWLTVHTFGRVVVDDRDQLRLDGKIVDFGLSKIILKLVKDGKPVHSLTNFLVKVSQNPNTGIAEDLYSFLSSGNIPLTPEGCFLAFKRVRDDYLDFYTGTVDYHVGKKPEMDRKLCDEDRNRTCSKGLHACSFDYLKEYHSGGGRIMVVMIDPRDVTAIPSDYNDTKLRCCLMEVVGEIPESEAKAYFTDVVDGRFSKSSTPDDDATAADGVHDGTDTLKLTEDEIIDEDKELTVTEAQVAEWGAWDGADDAEGAAAFICDPEDGENWSNVPENLDDVYRLNYVRTYLENFQLLPYYSELAFTHGTQDAKQLNDLHGASLMKDWSDGCRWKELPEEQDKTYAFAFSKEVFRHFTEKTLNANLST